MCLLQVNSVSWNETGTKLISGSDDCHVNIYDTTTDLVCVPIVDVVCI